MGDSRAVAADPWDPSQKRVHPCPKSQLLLKVRKNQQADRQAEPKAGKDCGERTS